MSGRRTTVGLFFDRYQERIRAALPGVQIKVRRGSYRAFPAPRDHARCRYTGPGRVTIEYAPRLLEASPARVEGVMLHELGHASLMCQGKMEHTERDADREAHRLFGKVIRYDRPLMVQTTGAGVTPRPSVLPR